MTTRARNVRNLFSAMTKFVLFVILVLVMQDGFAAAQSPSVNFIVINNGDRDICGLHVMPSESTVGWGESVLPPNTPIKQGERTAITLTPGHYHFWWVDCGGQTTQVNYHVDITSVESLVYPDAITLANISSPTKVPLSVRNDSAYDICSLHIVPQGAEWGESFLRYGPFRPGQQAIWYFAPGTYQIWIQGCANEGRYLDYNLDLSGDLVEITFDGADSRFRSRITGQFALTIQNDSESPICDVLVTPYGVDHWEYALATPRIAPGASGTWYFDSENYAVLIQPCDGTGEHRIDYLPLIMDTIVRFPDREHVARSDLLLEGIEASGLYQRGQYQAALQINLSLLERANQSGDLLLKTIISDNVGATYAAMGDFAAAQFYHNQAQELNAELQSPYQEVVIWHNLGVLHRLQGDYTGALASFNRSVEANTYSPALRLTSLNNIAGLFAEIGRYDAALEAYTEVLAGRREQNDSRGVINTLNAVATMHHREGRYDQAFEAYDEALLMARELGDDTGAAYILANIATMTYEQDGGQPFFAGYDAMLSYMSEAIPLAQSVSNPRLERFIYVTQALAYDRASWMPVTRTNSDGSLFIGNLDRSETIPQAVEAYEKAVIANEALLINAATDRGISLLSGSEISRFAYERLIVLLTQLSRTEQALHFAERGRALLVREELSSAPISNTLTASGEFTEREAGLRAALRSAHASPEAFTSQGQAQIRALETEYRDLSAQMRAEGDLIARQIAFDTADLPQIQAVLAPDETLIVYSIGGSGYGVESVAFVVTHNALEAVPLMIDHDTISQWVRALATDRQANAAVLRLLYDSVFAPIDSLVTTERLVISANGALQYVPIAALQSPDGSRLVEKYIIRMTPSATALVLLNDRETVNATGESLVLAQSEAPGLPPLQYVQTEARRVAEILGVSARLNATESDLHTSLSGAPVLHIAAHAQLDPRDPMRSTIFLRGDGQQDGRLEVRDIYSLDLAQGTRLVVLTGCETGIGGPGEDFGLLNRAFLTAGASQVVSSLWSVNDQSTAALMAAFYEAQRTHDTAAALRSAMLSSYKANPGSLDWAAFVMYGQR